MPAAWERYLEAESKLLDAIGQARGATKDINQAVKTHRAAIDKLVEAEVARHVAGFADEARARLSDEIDGIARELRSRLLG